MSQEDDLRGLAKVMEFMRAISIIFIVVHIYWFCYQAIVDMGINIGVVDKILLNFQNTAGLFSNLLVTKVFAIIFLALSCLGTKGVKNQKMTWQKIYATFLGGLVLFFMNWWMLDLPFSPIVNMVIYTVTMTVGYILLLMSGVWISRMFKHNLMEDVFNVANESFMQETRLMENEYTVNLPTKFVYQGKEWDGWINVVNPFRGRRRTNRAISVKLIYWLKLNVNNLKSAIWAKQKKITENIRKGMTSGWLGTSVGNYRFCFPEFPTNLRTPNGLNSIILSQFGMCK